MFVLATDGCFGTAAALVEPPPEQVVEVLLGPPALRRTGMGVAAAGLAVGIVAIGLLRRPLLAVGVDLAAVEPGALIGVGQQFVGGRNLLEPRLRLGVAGIQVGMVLLGQLAVGRCGCRPGWRHALRPASCRDRPTVTSVYVSRERVMPLY